MLPTEPRLLISIALGILPVFGIAIGLYDVIMRWINPPSRKVLPYPPGPRIANHLPRDNNWLVYSDWAKKYGRAPMFAVYFLTLTIFMPLHL